MKKLLSFYEGFTEYLHYMEAGETLVDVSFKHKVPIKDIINDNALTEEPLAGQYIVIRKRDNVAVFMPEDLSGGACGHIKDHFEEEAYPFAVSKRF